MKRHILIVEDEAAIRDMIRFALSANNFGLAEAADTRQAIEQIALKSPDLILLDWMLPDKSGIEFAKELKKGRNTRDIRIIMLTAKAEEENKIRGLESGVDDYVTKPFSPRELMARIKAVMRRGVLLTQDEVLQFNEMIIDVDQSRVSIGDQPVDLSPNEFRLLYFFVTHQNRVYSRDQLLSYVWGEASYLEERTVDVQVRRLRQALKTFGYHIYIQTVRGMGYRFQSQLVQTSHVTE